MKISTIFLAICLLVCMAGCNREHDRIGDAPRTLSTSSIPGWKEIATSGIALSLPPDWKIMDFTTSTLDKGADQVFGNDPKYASIRSQASEMAKQGKVKLFAFAPLAAGSRFATNCNVILQDVQGQPTLEQIAEATVRQVTPSVASGTQPNVEYISLDSGRAAVIQVELKLADPSIPNLRSYEYVVLKGLKLAAVTFGGVAPDADHLRSTADKAMRTFRFTN